MAFLSKWLCWCYPPNFFLLVTRLPKTSLLLIVFCPKRPAEMCNTQFSTTSWYLLLLSFQVQKLRCASNSWQFIFWHNESFGFLSLSRWLYSAIVYRPYFCSSAPLQWTFCYTQRGFWRVRRVWWRCTEQILWWRGGMPGKHPAVKHHFDPNCCMLMHFEHFLTCDITWRRVQSPELGWRKRSSRRTKTQRTSRMALQLKLTRKVRYVIIIGDIDKWHDCEDNNRWYAGTVAANPYQQQME